MKKVLALVLTVAMVCSSLGMAFADTTPTPTATPSPTTTVAPTATPTPTTTAAPTATPAAPVVAAGISADAKACADIGMIVGDGRGVTPAYTATNPTRLQAAIMFLRLKGFDKDALAFTGTENFKDANKMKWAGGKAIMAYLKAHPEFGWVGNPDGTFSPNDKLTAQAYYKVMLEALGYKANTTEVIGDFTWAKTIDFAKEKNMSKVASITNFTVDNMATATVEALKAFVKGSTTKTLAVSLVEAKKLDEAKLIAAGIINNATIPLAVTEVKALNLNQILVTFSKEVDRDTAENVSLYTLNNGGAGNINAELSKDDWTGDPSVVLQSDKKSVIITLDTKDDTNNNHPKLKNQIEATLSVEKVKTADKAATMASYTGKFSYTDTTVPNVESVSMLGTKVIRVKYTKPMSKANDNGVRTTSGYRLDKNALGNYNLSNIAYNPELQIATITFASPLTAGEHSLIVSKDNTISDIIGLKVVEKEIKFTVTDDQTAGVVKSATVDANKTYIEIEFNKPMATKDDCTGSPLTIDSRDVFKDCEVVVIDGKLRIKDTKNFTDLVKGGTHSVNLRNDSNNYLKDAYNVKYAASSVAYTLASDTTGPTVVSVTNTDSNKVEVQFNETITAATAENENYFAIKNADDKAVEVKNSERKNGSNDTVVLTLQSDLTKSGTGHIDITGIKDTSDNKMTAYHGSFTIGDKTGPSATAALYTKNHEIYVYFNENVDETTATNAANYLLDSKAISGATFTAVSGSVIKISVPASTALNDSMELQVLKDVTDRSGNKMKGVGSSLTLKPYSSSLDVTTWNGKTNGIKSAARAYEKDVIKIKLNKDLKDLNKADFQFNFGDAKWITADSASFANKDGNAEVMFSFNNDMMTVEAKSASNPGKNVKVRVNRDANYVASTTAADGDVFEKEALNGLDGTIAIDYIAPELVENKNGFHPAITIDVDKDGQIDHAILWFAEEMNTSTLNTSSVKIGSYTVTDVSTQTGTNLTAIRKAINTVDAKGDDGKSCFVVIRVDEESSSKTPSITLQGTWSDTEGNEMTETQLKNLDIDTDFFPNATNADVAEAAVVAYENLPLTKDSEVEKAQDDNGTAALNAIAAAVGSVPASEIKEMEKRVADKREIINIAYSAHQAVKAYKALDLSKDSDIAIGLENTSTVRATINKLTGSTVTAYKAALDKVVEDQEKLIIAAGTVDKAEIANGDAKVNTDTQISVVLKNSNNVVLSKALEAKGSVVKYTWTCSKVTNNGTGHAAATGDVTFSKNDTNPGTFKIADGAEAGDVYVVKCEVSQTIGGATVATKAAEGAQTAK